MAKYRAHLPQLDGGLFLTDGGLETTLYFRDGIEIPCFAAFDLLKDEAGTQRLRDYFGLYAGIARSNGVGFVLETVTWRANADWGRKIGYSSDALVAANHEPAAPVSPDKSHTSPCSCGIYLIRCRDALWIDETSIFPVN